MRKVQPTRVDGWREGRDFALHPEDPWYVRRCLQDAIARLIRDEISMEEFEKVKRELRRKRQIPIWFKERFILDYDDQIVLRSGTGLNPTESKEEEAGSKERPRVRQARLRLKEQIGLGGSRCCKVSRDTASFLIIKPSASAGLSKKTEQWPRLNLQVRAGCLQADAGGGGSWTGGGSGENFEEDRIRRSWQGSC